MLTAIMCIIAAIFVVAIVCLLILIRIQDSLNLYKCTKQIERDPWTRDVNVQVTYTGRPEDRKIEPTEQNVIDDLRKQYDEAREKDALTNLDSVIQNINALMGLTDAPDNTEENK